MRQDRGQGIHEKSSDIFDRGENFLFSQVNLNKDQGILMMS